MTSATPFLDALELYRSEDRESWHCPGHAHGAAMTKTPEGRKFLELFGARFLSADVCNAVEPLGQLLDASGPIEES